MWDLFRLIFGLIIDLFRSRAALEAEVLVLKQQIIVLRRGRPNRMPFLAVDRVVLGWACHLFPKARDALAIVRPDTVVRWHRAGFRLFWRWKSRRRLGRPAVPTEIQQLIREMSIANPLWGAPRIHGELLKLGIEVGQTSIAKYMVRRRGPAVAGLEDALAQSCAWCCGDGFVRSADHFLPASLWIADHGARPATNPLAGRHRPPNGRMDRQPTDGGLWLGANPPLF
jgi:hypothetical protein